MDSRRATMVWLLVALAVFAIGAFFSRREEKKPTEAPSWQRPVSELTEPQQKFFKTLREVLRKAEAERAKDKKWPEASGIFPPGFVLSQQGIYVNYSGESEGLRWLVLFIEPDPRFPAEKVPEDDEHHVLSDGTMIHVTVWTQALKEPLSQRVTAFPAAEGWVERVRR
jgi:hypothetical protein